MQLRSDLRAPLATALFLFATIQGCALHHADCQMSAIAASSIPRELSKATLPSYRVEPPDVLIIQAAETLSPNRSIEVGDAFNITMTGNDPEAVKPAEELTPIEQSELPATLRYRVLSGEYVVGADGALDLGPAYGKVTVHGLTREVAEQRLRAHVIEKGALNESNAQLWLELVRLGDRQAVSGEHLVRPDGTISLGVYGEVFVAGMTLQEIQFAVAEHLKRLEGRNRFQTPEVTVDVLSYNSKVIYVIMDGGGYGEQVIRLPYTGNETVLDAVAQVNGLSQVSSKKMWVARPAPACNGQTQILDVHWSAITAEGVTTTNYQLMPGDRIYVQADKLIATDNFLGKLLAPVERVFGVISLGRYAIEGQNNRN